MNETHYLGCLWRLSSYAVLRPIWSWEEDAYNVYFEAVVWTWVEKVCVMPCYPIDDLELFYS